MSRIRGYSTRPSDVRFKADFVCFTPNSRPKGHCPRGAKKRSKIGAKIVRHGRYVTFQLAEVAVPRELFRKILSLIDDLRPRPGPA